MLSSQMGSQPSRFTIPYITLSKIMSFDNQKRFEVLTHLGPLRISGVVGEDAYETFMDYHEKL